MRCHKRAPFLASPPLAAGYHNGVYVDSTNATGEPQPALPAAAPADSLQPRRALRSGQARSACPSLLVLLRCCPSGRPELVVYAREE